MNAVEPCDHSLLSEMEDSGVPRKRARRSYDPFKRLIDIVAALILLIVTAPIQLVVGVLVAANLGRPVLFKQDRPGNDARIFKLLKFRTMLDIDETVGIVSNEQRMTKLGSRLREFSLDELPSILNVLRGDISLVGPRPLLVKYLPLYTPEQARRHEVRPGLTGLAQVSGRNALDWDRRFALDVAYVDNRSLRLDIRILLLTVVKVVKREGISSGDGYVAGAPFYGTREPDGTVP